MLIVIGPTPSSFTQRRGRSLGFSIFHNKVLRRIAKSHGLLAQVRQKKAL